MKGDIMVGMCYKPQNYDEIVDTIFFEQIQNISGSDTFILMRDFNLSDTCWKGSTVGCNQPRFWRVSGITP